MRDDFASAEIMFISARLNFQGFSCLRRTAKKIVNFEFDAIKTDKFEEI